MTDNPLDKMPIAELHNYDQMLLSELASPGAQGLLGPDIIRQKSELRVALAGEMLRRSGIDPAGDSNDRMRSDGALPEPPVAVDQRRATLETIAELQQMANALPDDSVTKPSILKRIELDQALVDQAAQEAETPPNET